MLDKKIGFLPLPPLAQSHRCVWWPSTAVPTDPISLSKLFFPYSANMAYLHALQSPPLQEPQQQHFQHSHSHQRQQQQQQQQPLDAAAVVDGATAAGVGLAPLASGNRATVGLLACYSATSNEPNPNPSQFALVAPTSASSSSSLISHQRAYQTQDHSDQHRHQAQAASAFHSHYATHGCSSAHPAYQQMLFDEEHHAVQSQHQQRHHEQHHSIPPMGYYYTPVVPFSVTGLYAAGAPLPCVNMHGNRNKN